MWNFSLYKETTKKPPNAVLFSVHYGWLGSFNGKKKPVTNCSGVGCRLGGCFSFSSKWLPNVPPKKSSNTPSFFFGVRKDQQFPYLFYMLKGFVLSKPTKDYSENFNCSLLFLLQLFSLSNSSFILRCQGKTSFTLRLSIK